MKTGISIIALLLVPGAVSYGQAAPTATASVTPASSAGSSAGFTLPSLDGDIHYALSASQIVQYGYFGSGNVTGSAALSGDVSYSSLSIRAPFDLLYSGGVIISESGGQGTTTFQNLAASQRLNAGKWNFGLSDDVSYLPQSPTSGFSGVPGVGNIGFPVQGPGPIPSGEVLTYSGNRINNMASGSAERLLTGKTSVSAMGSWTILHFLTGSTGFDTSDVSGEAALNHRIDARDTVAVNAVYSLFTYGKSEGGIHFATRGVNGVYTRLLSSSLSMELSGGPQWLSSSDRALIPNSLNAAASAGLSYARGFTSASVGYAHGVNGGSGVQLGGLSDTATAGIGHSFSRTWMTSVSGAYSHTKELGTPGITNIPGLTIPLGGTFSTVFGGVQVTHSIGRTISVYANYTAQHQSFDASYTGTNAFSGTSHTFGVGITFAPRAMRLGQF